MVSVFRKDMPEIDAAKGLAILLVVIGHVTPRDIGLEWFSDFRSFIYGFHMPVFMYLSGYLFFFAGKHLLSGKDFFDYMRRRADRLLVPFLVFGSLIVLGKYLMGYVIRVDDPVVDLFGGFRYLFVDTSQSPAQSIWYLFVLFVVSFVTPFLIRIFGWWSLVLAALLVFAPGWDFLYFDKFRYFYVFFLVGGWFSCCGSDYLKSFWFGFLSLVLFVVSSFVFFGDEYRFLPMGLFGAIAIHVLLQYIGQGVNDFLVYFGKRSMVIYLLNTISIGVVKGVLFLVLPNMYSELMLMFLVLSGVAFPLLFLWLLNRFAAFSKIRLYFQ